MLCLLDNCTQLVAIDGVDGIGKTTLANDLAHLVERSDRPVIRASVDGFHNPREVRYRLGKNSPEGFFRESYNYDLLKKFLLNPLRSNGNRIYKSATFNVKTDAEVIIPEEIAPDLLATANVRYIEGQRIYLREYGPEALANIVVDSSGRNHFYFLAL